MSAPELSGTGEIRGDVLWTRHDVSEHSDSKKIYVMVHSTLQINFCVTTLQHALVSQKVCRWITLQHFTCTSKCTRNKHDVLSFYLLYSNFWPVQGKLKAKGNQK